MELGILVSSAVAVEWLKLRMDFKRYFSVKIFFIWITEGLAAPLEKTRTPCRLVLKINIGLCKRVWMRLDFKPRNNPILRSCTRWKFPRGGEGTGWKRARRRIEIKNGKEPTVFQDQPGKKSKERATDWIRSADSTFVAEICSWMEPVKLDEKSYTIMQIMHNRIRSLSSRRFKWVTSCRHPKK